VKFFFYCLLILRQEKIIILLFVILETGENNNFIVCYFGDRRKYNFYCLLFSPAISVYYNEAVSTK